MNHDPRCTLCRPDPLSLAYRSRHGGRDDFYVTLFRNKSGGSLTYAWRPLAELREMILATTAGDKHDLPLLKLARFGGKRSKNGSLRHDANVTAISGIEADYDAKQISFDDAVATVVRARLMAIVYTSPGHAASAPKWRVLLPTLSASAPSERARMMARINGVFGGIFAGESFTLSQAYYFGRVNDNPDHRAVIVDGDFIDQRDDLDAGAIGKAGRQRGNGHAFDPNERVDDDVLVNRVVYGESYHPSLVSLAARHVGRGESVEAVVEALRNLMDRAVAPHDDRWHHNYGDIPRTVRSAAEFVARKSDEDREADLAIASSANDPVVDERMMAELAARTANAEDRKSIGEDARTGHLGNHLSPDSATNDADESNDNIITKPNDAPKETTNGAGESSDNITTKPDDAAAKADGDNVVIKPNDAPKTDAPDAAKTTTSEPPPADDAKTESPKPPPKTKPSPSGRGVLLRSSAEFVAGFAPPDYLIDGLLQRHFLYTLTGRTGDGKTAVALRVAAHVAMGVPIAGMDVERGRVAYLAGENPDDVRMRWIKMCEELGKDPADMDVFFMPGAHPITTEQVRNVLMKDAFNCGPFSLVIVDTNAAFFNGVDENDNVVVATHAAGLRELLELSGKPTMLVTCHPTKNADITYLVPRGGGAFLAAVDGNLVVIRERGSTLVEIDTHGKFRGPEFAPFSFKLTSGTSERLRDSKGRLIWTVTAAPVTANERSAMEAAADTKRDALLRTMNGRPASSLAELATALGWTYKNGDPNKSLVQRLMAQLLKEKLVKKRGQRYELTDKGVEAADEAATVV